MALHARRRIIIGLLALTTGTAPLVADRPALEWGDSLGQYVPDDVWVFTVTRHTPERDFLKPHWERVYRAFRTCGIDEVFHGIFSSHLPPDEREAFEQSWQRATELISQVAWTDLIEHEFVFAERMGGLVPDMMFLCRPDPQTREANVRGLREILQTLAALDSGGAFRFADSETDGVRVCCLEAANAPIGLFMLEKNDILAIGIGEVRRRDLLALMAGKRSRRLQPITESKRYREALSKVPPPEYATVFFDFDRLFGAMRKIPEMLYSQDQLNETERASAVKLLHTIVGHFDSMDYGVTSTRMEGVREVTEAYFRLKPGSTSSSFAKMCFQRRPIEKCWRYIPVEAEGFAVNTLFDFEVAYDMVLETVRTAVPDGETHLLAWEKTQAAWDFNVREDVLSWLSGELISVSLPGRPGNPFGGSESVTLVRVKDAPKARAKVEAGLRRIAKLFDPSGQVVRISAAEDVKAADFLRIGHPFLDALQVQPCLGVWEEWIVLGSSAKCVNLVLDTAAGQHANVLKNTRFQREGLPLDGPVHSAAFADLRDFGDQMTTMFVAAGVVAGMIPDDPEAAPAKAMIGSLSRLGPVFAELDFLSSMSAISTIKDGEARSRKVVTYRVPQE